MTEREYRQDDETGTGYCPCGEPLSGLTVAGRGYCDRHGWTWAEWAPPIVCCASARATGGAYHAPDCEGNNGHNDET